MKMQVQSPTVGDTFETAEIEQFPITYVNKAAALKH